MFHIIVAETLETGSKTRNLLGGSFPALEIFFKHQNLSTDLFRENENFYEIIWGITEIEYLRNQILCWLDTKDWQY